MQRFIVSHLSCAWWGLARCSGPRLLSTSLCRCLDGWGGVTHVTFMSHVMRVRARGHCFTAPVAWVGPVLGPTQ